MSSLLPAAGAAAMAALVGAIGTDAPWTAFALFLACMVGTYVLDGLMAPLRVLVEARCTRAHRTRVARIACAPVTLDPLEDPEVQDLLHTASAFPRNWTEHTPGAGAVALIEQWVRWVGVAAAAAVLAVYVWWAAPLLIVAALVVRRVVRAQWLRQLAGWSDRAHHGRSAEYWREAATTPGTGKEVQVFGLAGWIRQRVQGAVHAQMDPVWEGSLRLQKLEVINFLIPAIPLSLVYAMAAREAAHDTEKIALLTGVIAAGWALYTAFGDVSGMFPLAGSRPALQALADLEKRLGGGPDVHAKKPFPAGSIELRGVRFAYPDAEREVLRGVDLAVAPGERVGLVGLNGAGKSTIIKILCGLYEPAKGQLVVGGEVVSAERRTAWRTRVAAVFQDFIRHPLSATENIQLGRPLDQTRREHVVRACEEAGLLPVLDRLPQGEDTVLTRSQEDGTDLSGGQWQQLALARALYAVAGGASLLVLDEPSAHLDVRTEKELFDRMAERPRDAAVLLVTHRLATVRSCDRILVLDDGRIAEEGSHDALMALDGLYAHMFRTQARRFAEGFRHIDEDEA
ncbi:ABC transporter ATP-binding protein [Streptomyces jeddahensis]|uniref:ABC transporter ATP-binding protein n=1 Tax=Streptomyces jeddahensis TaxID=1716141 RepID=UPI0012FFB75D|nr:ABC transporter ATP-binding protein [Streptomyces jeddahensis]